MQAVDRSAVSSPVARTEAEGQRSVPRDFLTPLLLRTEEQSTTQNHACRREVKESGTALDW